MTEVPQQPQMIPVQGTINPEVIERELTKLWRQSAGANVREVEAGDESALMRARVANLMVYASDAAAIKGINEVLGELSVQHPCRALIVVGEPQEADRDIEMFVSSFSHGPGKTGDRRLCCEEVTLTARGRFVVELPSATLPLLVPDLPAFLWWSDQLKKRDKVFSELAHRADRVIIDSAGFQDTGAQMAALLAWLKSDDEDKAAISDINWARLTSWRALLAGCFDTPQNRAALDQIGSMRIEYAANEAASESLASQALLIAGWLASRLDWKIDSPVNNAAQGDVSRKVKFEKDGRRIDAEFLQVERPQLKAGRLASVALTTESPAPVTFAVRRSEDGKHLETSVTRDNQINRTRVLPVRNRSAADLLGREMEIVCRDSVYEEAILKSADMVSLHF
ncbi:MAG TPA: glucose-6-phosphate dehydrogenase assembly protein OpcA [Pyrinomonadaceae bacterium]|jgi:glucose-6-phosphate dehydrogenase assembly protein OpcA